MSVERIIDVDGIEVRPLLKQVGVSFNYREYLLTSRPNYIY